MHPSRGRVPVVDRIRIRAARLAATIARPHHGRFDGTGYPRGLSGTEIPIEGRIVAIADTFDALTADRPYRAALRSFRAA